MLKRTDSRGIATAVALTVMLVVIILTFAITAISLDNLNAMTRDDSRRRALYAAEAGLNDAMASLHATIHAGGDPTLFTGIPTKPLPNNQTDTYTVLATNNLSGTNPTAPDGTTVPAGSLYLNSTGFHETATSSRYVAQTETAIVNVTSPVGTFALFGAQSLSIDQSGINTGLIDAWNSSQGPYAPPSPNANAAIGTNSTATGALVANPQVSLYGNIQVGPSGTASVASGFTPSGDAGANMTGLITTQRVLYALPQVTNPYSGVGGGAQSNPGPTPLPPGRYGSLTATPGQSVTLTSGTYSFGGDVTMTNSTLNLTIQGGAPVIVYLDGNWSTVETPILNPSLLPSNFQVYGTDTTTAITMTTSTSDPGWASFPQPPSYYAVVYARNAAITLTAPNCDFFGSLVGQSVTSTGDPTNFHFDMSLKSLQTVPVLQLTNIGRR